MSIDYKKAGVDIEAGNEAVNRIKSKVKKTFNQSVLTGLGGFGALYDLKTITSNYENPVLVQSIDGVGTKTIIARMMKKYDTIGMDLVSATTNDIVVMGAKPYTLLDYIANDRLDPDIIESIVAGMSQACCDNDIALIGGETAEMPDTYLPGEHDIVGVVTGIVEKDKVINGSAIQPGDKLYAFASSGLHTNGFSLARKLLFQVAGFGVEEYVNELRQTLGEALLVPHINYTKPVFNLLDQNIPIKGMAHITGGGLIENVPRMLPENCMAEIHIKQWPEQALFSLLSQLGELSQFESYRTFNMGVGLVFVVDKDFDFSATESAGLPIYSIGEILPAQSAEERVVLK